MASMDQVHKLITFQHAHDKAVDHNDLLVSNVAAAAQPNLNASPGLPGSSNPKLQLVAIAPSLFLWDESIRRSLQKVEAIHQHIEHISNTTQQTPVQQ